MNTDTHGGSWSPWCRGSSTRVRPTQEQAGCAQGLDRNMTPSTVVPVKVKAVSAPERAAGRRLWVQMEKQQGDFAIASMEALKKKKNDAKLQTQRRVITSYVCSESFGSFRSHQSLMSCLVQGFFLVFFLFFLTCYSPSPFFWSQTVLISYSVLAFLLRASADSCVLLQGHWSGFGNWTCRLSSEVCFSSTKRL